MERGVGSASFALAYSAGKTFSQLLASRKHRPGRPCHLWDPRHIPQSPIQECLGYYHITAGINIQASKVALYGG